MPKRIDRPCANEGFLVFKRDLAKPYQCLRSAEPAECSCSGASDVRIGGVKEPDKRRNRCDRPHVRKRLGDSGSVLWIAECRN